MNEERARDFWERALDEIQDDGFFAPVSTAEPPPPVEPPAPVVRRHRPRFSDAQLVLMVVAAAVILALSVVIWLAPALYF